MPHSPPYLTSLLQTDNKIRSAEGRLEQIAQNEGMMDFLDLLSTFHIICQASLKPPEAEAFNIGTCAAFPHQCPC